MCKLSRKLKLCTCTVASPDLLQNYWILYRFNRKNPSGFVVGMVILPKPLNQLGRRVQAYNQSLLLKRLEEGDAFDVNMDLQHGDRLQLTFTCTESTLLSFVTRKKTTKKINYAFSYRNGLWLEEDFDSSLWRGGYHNEKFGEIHPALHGESLKG